MFKPLEVYIGLRYTRAKRRNHFVSFISMTSMIGIALGVIVMIVVLSVMNGYEKLLRERILGMVSHATISSLAGYMDDWGPLAQKAREQPRVLGAAPYITGEVMLTHQGRVTGAQVRGIIPDVEKQVSEAVDKVVAGDVSRLAAGEYGIVLGADLARALGVGMEDVITMVTPETSVSVVGVMPRVKRFTVVGIVQVGMYEYDRTLALTHLEDAAKLFRTGGGVTGIRLKFDDLMRAPFLARDVERELEGIYRVRDWSQQHANFFRAVRTEKTVMFVILTFIVAVAAFNIVSTLVMVVTDKQADIAILRTLGISPRSIMAVFIVQGATIGVIGTVLGVAGGVALALNVETIVPAIERFFHVQFMPADIYVISDFPSDLRYPDVVKIGVVAFLLSLIATVYPAWRAARTQPAEALRYE